MLAAIAGWSIFRVKATEISSDTVIQSNHAIGAQEKLILKNGAHLTIKGDLDISGSIVCVDGPLNITVEGNLAVNKKIECYRPEDTGSDSMGMNIIVSGVTHFDKNAVISSNAHIQVVKDAKDLLKTQSEIDKVYQETGEDTGAGPRVGPFVSGNATQKVSLGGSVPVVSEAGSDSHLAFIRTAHAQVPRDKDGNAVENVIIGGHWYVGDGGSAPSGLDIPKPPKGVHKIIVNFNFGQNGNVTFQDFYLVGPDGRDGNDDEGKSCNAKGEKGEDAFRMRVQANALNINNFTLQLGNGGNGGIAETKKDCDPGIAVGGKGGEAGNFKMTAANGIIITSFHIIPGRGGNGGMATANGKDGVAACPGTKGGDAIATGGDGGANKKELSAIGSVTGIGNVTVDAVEGGLGGEAIANPGKGGNGTGCNCNGGKGGNATTTGGKGGEATLKLIGGAGTANGGNGGDADSHGGVGGTGGMCPMKPSGGNGGAGGDAKSKEGQPGTGTTADGNPGAIKDETGGDGGNGGDGCGPGGGGNGGNGKPKGADGKPGNLACPTTSPTPKYSDSVTQPTPTPTSHSTSSTSTPQPTPTPETQTGTKVQVIMYQGKYLPIDQLIIEAEKGCDGGQAHWHAAHGLVQATDGSIVVDPGPQCGYGKQSQTPVMQIMVSH